MCVHASETAWKYPVSFSAAPLILSALCKAGSPQGQPISDYPRWLAALSAAMGECLAVTWSLIGGDLSSGAGSEVTEDWRREMLPYDWFMSDSRTQADRQEKKGTRVKGSTCMFWLVVLVMVYGKFKIQFASDSSSSFGHWRTAEHANYCDTAAWKCKITLLHSRIVSEEMDMLMVNQNRKKLIN